MAPENLALFAATYDDAAAAESDYKALKAAEGADLVILGSVVLSRGADGNVSVSESEGGQIAIGGTIGATAGLIVGLFAPPLLLSTAIGAGIGAIVGEFTKKHEEKEIGVELDEYLPVDSSAIVVVVDNRYLDGIDHALTKADKKVNKAIDSGDYEKLQKAIADATDDVSDAVDS